MRRHQRQEVQHVMELFANYDKDISGTISDAELNSLLTDLGYTITAEVLAEVLTDAKVLKKKVSSLSEFIAHYESGSFDHHDESVVGDGGGAGPVAAGSSN